MADETAPAEPEIDVDALDDKAFDDLKTQMRAGKPAETPPKPKYETPATTTAKTDAADPDANADEDDDAEPQPGNKTETVPHQQFHRERERRKAAETEKNALQANYNKAMERLQALIDAQAPKQPERAAEPEIPTWEGDNPIAAGAWTQERVIALEKRLNEQAAAEQQANARSQVLSRVNNDLSRAIQAEPAIKDAHSALRQSLGKELMGMGRSPEQAFAEVLEIETAHAEYVAANNIPIGDYIKTLAAARGWAPPAAQTPAVNDTLSEAEKIAKREETRLAAQSLGKGAGATADTGRLTPEQVLELPDEEFAAYVKKHGGVAHAFRA